jgi:hypothetical protein
VKETGPEVSGTFTQLTYASLPDVPCMPLRGPLESLKETECGTTPRPPSTRASALPGGDFFTPLPVGSPQRSTLSSGCF